MLFGLFGGRMTTDDSLEQTFEANTHNAVQQSAQLQMRQRQSSRFDEEMEYWEELRTNLSQANLELGRLRVQVKAFEAERANWKATAMSGATRWRALQHILSRNVGKEEAVRLEEEEVQVLLRDEALMEYFGQWSDGCATKPWRLKKL